MSTRGAERNSSVEQEKFATKRLIVKIGSNSITDKSTKENPLNTQLIDNIAKQCSHLFKNGVEVVIVSSGAIACGRNLLPLEEHSTRDRQIEALYGQPTLIESWVSAFRKYGVVAGQILLTEHDLGTSNQSTTAEDVLRKSLKYGVAIININDAVTEEAVDDIFQLTDNDTTVNSVAKAIAADTVLMLTNVDGVLDKEGGVIVNGMKADDTADYGAASEKGTGGIITKVGIMHDLAYSGIKGFLAKADREDIILAVARGSTTNCTIFDPEKK